MKEWNHAVQKVNVDIERPLLQIQVKLLIKGQKVEHHLHPVRKQRQDHLEKEQEFLQVMEHLHHLLDVTLSRQRYKKDRQVPAWNMIKEQSEV